ncbi:MAG: rod-binding protein [Planctomycetaceae bacterium]
MTGLSPTSAVRSLNSTAQSTSQMARLMNSASQLEGIGPASTLASTTAKTDTTDKVRETFQDFVAGTFYKQMFKALRSGQDKPAYLHGGAAEEMFQAQLDQQVAEDLARQHGAQFSDSMYDSFQRQVTGNRLSALA